MASGSGDGEVKLWNYAEAMVTIHRRRRRRQQQQQQEQQQQRQQLQQQQQQQQQQIDDSDNLRTSNNGTPDNNIQHDDNDDDDDDEIWRGISMEVSHASHPHTHVDCLAFNSTGETLASSGDGTIRLWDVHTRSCIAALREDDIHVVESISFSPDGKTLAAGNWGNKISLWDVDSHHIIGSAAESTCVHSVCFSPSQPQHLTRTNVCEYQLCSATDHRDLRLWKISDDHLTTDLDNTARQQQQQRQRQQRQQQRQYMTSHTSLVGHVDTVWSVVFSSNGLLIASGSGDGTCRVWNSSTGRCLRVLNQQHDDDVDVMPNSVYCVSFSPCNGYVAAARDDGSIEIGRCC
jgi:WD40 repeat protein